MAELMFACPNNGREVSTGIEVTPADFAQWQNQRKLTQCPYCKMVHGWMIKDAWLKATAAEIAQACEDTPAPQTKQFIEI